MDGKLQQNARMENGSNTEGGSEESDDYVDEEGDESGSGGDYGDHAGSDQSESEDGDEQVCVVCRLHCK